jgi:hypothetical protein
MKEILLLNTFLYKALHIFFALLTFYTVFKGAQITNDKISNYFSYFSVISALLLVCLYLFLSYGKRTREIESARGAVTIYMVITGITFAVLLNGGIIEDKLLDFIAHKLIPAVVLIEWIIYPPKHDIKFKTAIFWYLFPAFYFIYVLFRGAITGWYPYPFFDPGNGVMNIVIHAGGITLGFFILSFILILIGNRLKK